MYSKLEKYLESKNIKVKLDEVMKDDVGGMKKDALDVIKSVVGKIKDKFTELTTDKFK